MKLSGVTALLSVAGACLALGGCDIGGDGSGERRGLRVHPENPRYLEFRGEATALITSGEHYGAVVNADFDYTRYLDELASHGFNQTRVFSGSYIEAGDSSERTPTVLRLGYDNTLAPRPGRYVSPWAQVGGGRFDLSRWNAAYFERLKRFIGEAGQREIVVELVLFSTVYNDEAWEMSPFNSANNANGVGAIEPSRLYTLENGGLLRYQDRLVRKLVAELRSYDNLYYEVINEGWIGPTRASEEWETHVVRTIRDAESGFGEKHLIARNLQAGVAASDIDPSVPILNFHYQRDPSAYLRLGSVVALDETGARGTSDAPYRNDGWFFMLSGGGVYSNLDFSFTPTREDGSFDVPDVGAGGGGPSLRRSLAALREFLERFDLPRMSPDHGIVRRAPGGAATRVLADRGRSYAVYVGGPGSGPLVLELPAGSYQVEWVDPVDGAVLKRETLDHAGSEANLTAPTYGDSVALAIEAEGAAGSEDS